MLHDVAKDRLKIGPAVTDDQRLRVSRGGCLAEKENNLDRFV
jgi:hypothetical protein